MQLLAGNLPKYIVTWVGEAVAYWIFIIICIDSQLGFNWWLADKPHRFGGVCIVYAVKALLLLILVPIQHKRLQGLFGEAKFPWIDIAYFVTHLIFWVVSVIYAFDREITAEHVSNADWVKRYKKWNDEIYILPVVKLCVDFVYAILAALVFPLSHTAMSGGAIIWMDLQYLFVYLFISGKNAWENYFIVFVWIYMGSIIATLAAVCLIGFVVLALVKKQEITLSQIITYLCLSIMIILFFVWENIVGSKDYKKDNIYILLVAIIIYTLFNAFQTFALWRGIQMMPNGRN